VLEARAGTASSQFGRNGEQEIRLPQERLNGKTKTLSEK